MSDCSPPSHPAIESARLRVRKQRELIASLHSEGKDIDAAVRLLQVYLEILRLVTTK